MRESLYREAESRLWQHYGPQPSERFVQLPRLGTRVRVQEVGSGQPALFIHGGPNSGSTWAPLVAHLTGIRCLMVDRPGTGLSDSFAITPNNLAAVGAEFVSDVLDGLGLEQADVVASSFGGHLALRSAAAHSERFRRMVQMACPALVPGDGAPPFMRLFALAPIRALINALPPSERANVSILRQIGHGASLDEGRIPQAFFDWYMALARNTDTMRNDGRMIGNLLTLRGPKPGLRLSDELLAAVNVPTLFFWGADDTFGGLDVARHLVDTMPQAELVTVDESGHLPWIDFPAQAAAATQEFLQRVPT